MTAGTWVGRPLGVVPTDGRGSLPFALLADEALVEHASAAIQRAGVDLLDFNVTLRQVRESGRPLVVHDPLCPLTPPAFIRQVVEVVADEPVVVVGVQPVTDTIKTSRDGVVGRTVDREGLWAVTSPVVLPPGAVARLTDWSDLDDLALLVGTLRADLEVRFLPAPALARRVEDESAVALLAAFAAERS